MMTCVIISAIVVVSEAPHGPILIVVDMPHYSSVLYGRTMNGMVEICLPSISTCCSVLDVTTNGIGRFIAVWTST